MILELEKRIKPNPIRRVSIDSKKKQMSWDIEENFSLYLDYLGYFPQSKDYDKVRIGSTLCLQLEGIKFIYTKVFMELAIYHGHEIVSQKRSDKVDAEKGKEYHYLAFSSTIDFDVKIKNLHRCAKLCVSLQTLPKRGKVKIKILWNSSPPLLHT